MPPPPKGSGRHHTFLDMDVDGEQALHDLEEDIIVMQDANEDTAHDNLEDEMNGVVNEINEETEGLLGSLDPTRQKETLFLMKKVCLIRLDSSRITDGATGPYRLSALHVHYASLT